MAIMENAEGVSSEKSVAAAGRGPMNSPESTWPRNPTAFTSRFRLIGGLAKAFNPMTRPFKKSGSNPKRNLGDQTKQLEASTLELDRTKTSALKMLEELQDAKRELEMVTRQLKEMDETNIRLIGIASHELKTPLTAIKANIDFILSEKEGKIPENLKSYLITIQRNTNRIQMRMDQMLDLSRMKSNRLLFNREPILLAEVIE